MQIEGMAGSAGAQSTAEWTEEQVALAATQMGFTCAISQEIMEDPVVATDGHSYERASIREWLAGNDTSPMTGERLANKTLTPNRNLKSNIQTWLEMQHGETRAEKRRKTSAGEIKKFLAGLNELVRTDNIGEMVNGLQLGEDLELHTRVLDALCRYGFGGQESCARIVAGGGLQASVATMKVHMRPCRNGWGEPCLDACSILEMVVLKHNSDRQANLVAIDRAGGIQAVADLANARYMDVTMLMRALHVLCQFLDVVTLPTALQVADMVVAGVVETIVKAMEAHSKNLALLASACKTLGELARVVQGRRAEANIAKISAGGGVLAVVRAVEGNLAGGGKADRHIFLMVACSALHVCVLDDTVRQSEEAIGVICCLCSVIRKYPTQDGVLYFAMQGLLAAAGTCAEKKALAHKGLGGVCGMMLVLNKNLARKQSAAVAETLGHTLRLLERLYMGDVRPHDGYVQTIVGVMKTHVQVLQVQVSAVLFLKQCRSIPGMDAVIIGAGGIEALLESVRKHVNWRLETSAWHTLGLLVTAPTREKREERVARVMAAGGMEVVLCVMARQVRGPGRLSRLAIPLHNALLVLPKLCAADANYRQLVELRGVEKMAQTVSLYRGEQNEVMCMNVLQRIYCRPSAEYGGLPFSEIEAVVRAMERHGGNGVLQQAACAIVGMYFRCVRVGAVDLAGPAGVEWCMRAVLASMQRNTEKAAVLEVGFKSLLRFLALREAHDKLLDGIAAVFAGGGGELALGALRTHKSSVESTGMRGGALTVLAVLCVCSEKQTAVALDGGVQHALDSLRSGACGETEACDALDFLARIAGGNEKTTAEIVVRGGIGAALVMLSKGAAVGTGARALAQKACEVLVAVTGSAAECEAFALQGGLGAVVRAMTAFRPDVKMHRLVVLLCRVSRIESLQKSVATAGGIAAVAGFVGTGAGSEATPVMVRSLHDFASELVCNLAETESLWVLLKEDALGWIETVLATGVGVSESARGRYAGVAETLRGVTPAEVVCPYCGEGASGLAAFEGHMEWHCAAKRVRG